MKTIIIFRRRSNVFINIGFNIDGEKYKIVRTREIVVVFFFLNNIIQIRQFLYYEYIINEKFKF